MVSMQCKKTSKVKNPVGRMAVIEQGGFRYACFDGHVERYMLEDPSTKMYNDLFTNDPTASIYYAHHPSPATCPASSNKDFYEYYATA